MSQPRKLEGRWVGCEAAHQCLSQSPGHPVSITRMRTMIVLRQKHGFHVPLGVAAVRVLKHLGQQNESSYKKRVVTAESGCNYEGAPRTHAASLPLCLSLSTVLGSSLQLLNAATQQRHTHTAHTGLAGKTRHKTLQAKQTSCGSHEDGTHLLCNCRPCMQVRYACEL